MNSFFSKLFVLFLLPLGLFAQDTRYLSQHEIALNYSPPSRWSYNFEVTNRNTFPEEDQPYSVQHVEFSHFTTYESGFYGSVSLGLRYRNQDWFEPGRSNEVRLTQQYNYARMYNQYRLGHRLRVEQRFYENETVYRARYRLNLDFPLQGLRLDDGEFYTAIGLETLYSISALEKPDLNQRLTLTLGNQISGTLKLQIAAEYRKEDLTLDQENRVFFYTAAKIKL
ncbi:MAG: hypothetical protein COA80_07925 [Leeuwenhoekiella sp.]|nr:MAG: hypothetical protein COA80_07925 [Leeuwenhoekiella sp.]